jgi:hypothetical protein
LRRRSLLRWCSTSCCIFGESGNPQAEGRVLVEVVFDREIALNAAVKA